MNSNKGLDFVPIQGWMRKILDLKGAELLVYATIYCLSQGDNICTLSNDKMIEFWGFSEKTLQRARNELFGQGLIERSGGGWTTTYDPENTESEDETADEEEAEKGDILSPRQNDDTDILSEKGDILSPEGDILSSQSNIKINNINNINITNTSAGACACEEEIMERWFEFKDQRKEPVPEISKAMFIDKTKELINEFGIERVKEVVDYSIENNYPVIYWDRLEKPSQVPAATTSRQASRDKEGIYGSNASYDLQRYARLGLENFDILED